MHEQKQGGTWYTINYARKVKKDLIIIFPDGQMKREGSNDYSSTDITQN